MIERNQLELVCRWNSRLSAENRRLRNEIRRLSQANRELMQGNAELGGQLEAADTLLGAAIDQALGAA
ncbi:MAG: hypothetical protein ACTHM1_12030 [Solirubrobacteraceae bacterium]